jgi:mannitol/fructose-specific phosphotransferase system IIA component (Ntr-type)
MSTTVTDAIAPELVALDVVPPADRDALFDGMIAQLSAAGRIGDPVAFREALEERESLGSTYMGNDLALPHGRSATVTRPSIVFWRLASAMTYASQDEEGPVTKAVMLAVPEGSDAEHLRALALLARMLMHDESVAALDAATRPEQVVAVVAAFARTHS